MNWLMYIGGGILVFIVFMLRVMKMEFNTHSLKEAKQVRIWVNLLTILSFIATWIWICWRFI